MEICAVIYSFVALTNSKIMKVRSTAGGSRTLPSMRTRQSEYAKLTFLIHFRLTHKAQMSNTWTHQVIRTTGHISSGVLMFLHTCGQPTNTASPLLQTPPSHIPFP